MRISYRYGTNKDYWQNRWDAVEIDEPMQNKNKYPLKYALETVKSPNERIMEAGCGNGRILRYFHDKGYNIIGIDFIASATEKLKEVDPSLQAEPGDITNLKYDDCSFDTILSFGLYHNLMEAPLDKAIKETHRVLKDGGSVCASFRADNIQERITDYIRLKETQQGSHTQKKEFHKLNLTKKEYTQLFKKNGFTIKKFYPVQNMPFLYKFRIFRRKDHKEFNESKGRNEGYQLSFLGKIFQKFSMSFFPNQFCNIYVLIAEKNVLS